MGAPTRWHGFTDRVARGSRPPYDGNLGLHVGDDSHTVQENRHRLLSEIGARSLCFVTQVHGNRVVTVRDPATGVVEIGTPADGLVTANPGVAVAVLVADCVPVLIADPKAGVVGVAHAGRPGLSAGVIEAVVDAMHEEGAQANRMLAVVGPGICGSCYEVPAAMRDDEVARVPGIASITRRGTPALDLPAGAEAVLRRRGIAVSRDDRCPAEDPMLFSYRRDGRTGRFAGWAVVR